MCADYKPSQATQVIPDSSNNTYNEDESTAANKAVDPLVWGKLLPTRPCFKSHGNQIRFDVE
jgi:hypothetical protein